MTYNREVYVAQMRAYLGAEMGNAKHRHIIDMYNSHKPLARGYKVKYTDPWCATTVSAAAIECGYTEIIPTECSCTRQIELLKQKNSFEPDDNYIPTKGDLIYYRWSINGREPIEAEDVDGVANHVGVVEECDGKYITVIEGNMNNKCQRRKVKVGWKYIHGFGVPKFDSVTTYYVVKRGDTLSRIAKMYNTTVSAICTLNPWIENPNNIQAGWKIQVR